MVDDHAIEDDELVCRYTYMNIPCTENICFTTTAMPRPELLEKTYASFCKNIKWLDFKKITLFLNLDRFPQRLDDSEDEKSEQVIAIARNYFGEVIVNRGIAPNFPNAVKWVFSNANREYIFNLEDDWELLCELPDSFLSYFANEKVMQVGFRATQKSNPRFVLSPSILRASYAHKAAQQLHYKKNPELTIRAWNPNNVAESFIYWPLQPEYVILKDLGRGWMKDTAFGRGMDEWTTWKFLPNSLTRARDQMIEDQNAQINYDILKNIKL